MRGAIYLFSLILVWLGSACASRVDVRFDERADFSRYHAWDWLPDSTSRVDAPHADPLSIDARLTRLIEEALGKRGYERAAERANFFVSYQLVLRRRKVAVEVPFAPYLLSSYHSSASYWIEGSETVHRIYEDLRLVVRVADADARITWQAAVERRFENEVGDRSLKNLVATLLDRFPAHRSGGRPRKTPADGSFTRRVARLQIDRATARTPETSQASRLGIQRADSGPVTLCTRVIGLPPGFFCGRRNAGEVSL